MLMKLTADDYICNGKCLSSNIPCNGTCINEDWRLNCNGECDREALNHLCNGKCLSLEIPCNGKCIGTSSCNEPTLSYSVTKYYLDLYFVFMISDYF